MYSKIAKTRAEIDLLSAKAYHYLEGHKLNENTLDQIVIAFNLNPIEVLRLTRKIQRLKRRYYISTKILARSIIKTRYKQHKENVAIPFDEMSPLANF